MIPCAYRVMLTLSCVDGIFRYQFHSISCYNGKTAGQRDRRLPLILRIFNVISLLVTACPTCDDNIFGFKLDDLHFGRDILLIHSRFLLSLIIITLVLSLTRIKCPIVSAVSCHLFRIDFRKNPFTHKSAPHRTHLSRRARLYRCIYLLKGRGYAACLLACLLA